MNTQVHSTEPSGEAVQRAAVGGAETFVLVPRSLLSRLVKEAGSRTLQDADAIHQAQALYRAVQGQSVESDWRPFGLTVEHALSRGDDPALLFDENSPIRGELRRLLASPPAVDMDAARYHWLRGEVQGPHIPLAQVVWKVRGIRNSGEWTNLPDGEALDRHIDAALAKGGAA